MTWNMVGNIRGPQGPSAYEVWLGLGNTGTEQDFIDSLQAAGSSTVDWENLVGAPTEFPPLPHDHDDRYYTEPEVDAEIGAAIATHEAAGDPHPQYQTSSETQALVDAAIAALIDGAPGALDTLKEIADQLALDESASSAILAALETHKSSGDHDARYIPAGSLNSLMQVVDQGTNANYPRPVGALAVYWIGSVEPLNAINNDLWVG